MSHSRNDSQESSTSSTTSHISTSSESSVQFYEQTLKPTIDAVSKSRVPLQELVDAAEKIINEKFAPDSQSTFTHKTSSTNISVQLDQVMLAMLACAEECGGRKGKRYVASAIVSCSKAEDVVGALAALGTTWLTHLLFIFKTTRGHGKQPNEQPSGLATPTLDDTAAHLLKGVGHRKGTFPDDLMVRDGYTCVVTGTQDPSHPAPTAGRFITPLVGAHILRRAIGEFNKDHTSKSFKSASTTFDILVNFTRLPVTTLEELHDQIDHPSNGMILQHDAHLAFDNFHWCLKETEEKHVYDLKIFKDQGLLSKPANNRVTFVDHSNDFPSGSSRKRNRTFDLPDPQYIAIHAAIAGVLNMSGAGRFFDELLDKYKDDEGKVSAVRSWPELETLIGEQLLSQSVTQLFQSVQVR